MPTLSPNTETRSRNFCGADLAAVQDVAIQDRKRGQHANAARVAGVSQSTILRRFRSGYSDVDLVKNELIRKIKLCREDAAEIKRLLAAGIERKQIYERFGVSHTTLSHIARGITWKTA